MNIRENGRAGMLDLLSWSVRKTHLKKAERFGPCGASFRPVFPFLNGIFRSVMAAVQRIAGLAFL